MVTSLLVFLSSVLGARSDEGDGCTIDFFYVVFNLESYKNKITEVSTKYSRCLAFVCY